MPLPIEDVVAIQQLYANYNHLIDAGRGQDWAALFTPEGTLDTGLGIVVEGTPAARAEFAVNVPVMMPGSRHLASNLHIEGEGSAATGAAYLQLWVADDDGGVKLMVTGIYQDTLEKLEGQWRFVTRVLVPDAGGPVPGKPG